MGSEGLHPQARAVQAETAGRRDPGGADVGGIDLDRDFGVFSQAEAGIDGAEDRLQVGDSQGVRRATAEVKRLDPQRTSDSVRDKSDLPAQRLGIGRDRLCAAGRLRGATTIPAEAAAEGHVDVD